MPIHYTLADVRNAFPAIFYERGLAISQQNRIQQLHYADDNHTLLAKVQGSRTLPYHQRVQLGLRNGKLLIEGSCDCPIGRNCKHVIAVLLHALQAPPTPNLGGASTARNEVTPAVSREQSVQQWLTSIEQLVTQPETEPDGMETSRLLYVLSPAARSHGLDVRLMRARVKKDQTLGKAMRYSQFTEIALGRGGALATADDRLLCARIFFSHPHNPDWPRIAGPGSGQLLHDLIQTGRVWWIEAEGSPLRTNEPLRGELIWQADAQDNQQLTVTLPPGWRILTTEPPWIIHPMSAECRQLDVGLPDALATILLQSPAIPAERIPDITQQLAEKLPGIRLPEPESLQSVQLSDTLPQPLLTLLELPVNLSAQWKRRDDTSQHNVPAALIEFRYHQLQTTAGTPGDSISQRIDGQRMIACRNLQEEQRLIQQLLTETSLLALNELFPSLADDPVQAHALGLPHAGDWLALMLDDIPRLRNLGWQITIRDDFPYKVAEHSGDFSIDIDERSGTDWFGLDLGIDIDGERISLLPILLQTLQQYTPEQIRDLTRPDQDPQRKLVCVLPDRRMIGLPMARLQGILSVLVELFDSNTRLTDDGRMEMHALHAARLAELEAHAGARWLGGERLLQLGRKLRDFRGITPVAPPSGLNATLRGYQQDGLNWLQFLREYHLAGVLADDMGLGKTLQALAHILLEKQSGRGNLPCLVVAPTSLMFNWKAEAERFTPDLRVLVLHGNDRRQHFDQIGDYDLVLTTYPLLPRDREFLTAQRFHLLILDEAHAIKNPKALATQIVHQIHAHHRLALTGTPLENHLGELWSLFHFLLPGLLGGADSFKQQFRTPIEKHDDKARSQVLAQRVKPFLLRRTKAQVATELPPRTDIVRSCELLGPQRDLYESVRSVMHDKIRREIDAKGFRKSQIVILDALLKLRQVCCDPRLLKLNTAHKVQQSAKLDMLVSLLPEMIEEGRRILLFSQFTSMLDLIEPELHLLKIPFVRLTGETHDRALPVHRFQNGEVPLFLISLKAGGVGLNLTAADTVIHYDPWWNPAVEEQATGRAHRIGQINPVFAWKLITLGTVEEKILGMQERKRNLSQGVLGDASTGVGSFTPDELISLFEPD